MLEVLYDKLTNQVRGWCADEEQFDNFQPKPNEAVVIFPIDPPVFQSDVYHVDLVNKTVVGNPDYKPAPPRNLEVELDQVKADIAVIKTKVGVK